MSANPKPDAPARNIAIALPVLGEDEWQAVREPILSGWVTQGPKVAAFEKAFAERHQVPHALAVTSCTTGLQLALAGLDIGAGDEVIVPAFTWVASANVVVHAGATPVFADIDIETFNVDPAQIAAKLTDKTKAVMVVHLFGRTANMDAIRAVLPDHVAIIEDAACAAGSHYKGTPAGALGDAAAFSFHPRKSITTGEGGMVTTRDAALGERMERIRNHGASISEEQRHHGPRPYLLPDFDLLGHNFRMTDLQGAIGLVQMTKLDSLIDERAKWADYYAEQLAELDWLQLPKADEGCRHGWQAYVTYVDPEKAPMPRNDMMEKLQAMGVSTRPGTHAVHMLGYYREQYGLKPEDFPAARNANDHSMAIPLHNRMSADDYAYVVSALKSLA